MIVESKKHGVTGGVESPQASRIPDPRERPLERRAHADQLHARFVDRRVDFLTLLNLWNYLKDKEKELSGNQSGDCVSRSTQLPSIREWADLYRHYPGPRTGSPHDR